MNDKDKILCFDSHLDISMNAMEWNRDQRWTVEQIRESEQGLTDKPDRGQKYGFISCIERRQSGSGGGHADCKGC